MNSPVTLEVTEPVVTQIHVSQNVPRNSEMNVQISGASGNEIHVSQVRSGERGNLLNSSLHISSVKVV